MTGCERARRGARGAWWRSGVLYQLYPRSFADSDGDGHGDLEGIIGHLDHLAWLGVDGIWLNPITPSPNADWGYDVADYTSVEPDFGDLDVLDRLVARAGERGIRVILDLVPNHTSDSHPWFLDARSSRTARHRDWYVWADARPDGGPPNNWVSVFGGSAWTWDEPTQQYYLHNFLAEQPDLNWWNDEVRDAFDDIMRFWFDRGISGFRIDVAHGIVKDIELRDNPSATADDDELARALGQRPGVQHEPAGGARRPAALARDRRRVRARSDPARRDVGPRPIGAHALLRRWHRRAPPGVERPVRLRGARDPDAGDRGTGGGRDPRWGMADVDRVEPRRRSVRRPGGAAATTGRSERRS